MRENESSNPEFADDRVAELKRVIAEAPGRIEAEFSRTANDWLSCFGSSIFVVETYMSSPKYQAMFTPGAFAEQERRLEALKERLSTFKEQYPEKEPQPPDAVKQELLVTLQGVLA